MHVEYYEPCLEFDRCNELMDLYWKSKQFDRCFEGHLKLAEETHYPLAECQTGYFYWKGIGVEPNMQKALYWTNLSAIHGDWDCPVQSGHLLRRRPLRRKESGKGQILVLPRRTAGGRRIR